MLFLRAAETQGVALPCGAFAVAKMLDGMLSQQLQVRAVVHAHAHAHHVWRMLHIDCGRRASDDRAFVRGVFVRTKW
jgi:hypothetical protein